VLSATTCAVIVALSLLAFNRRQKVPNAASRDLRHSLLIRRPTAITGCEAIGGKLF